MYPQPLRNRKHRDFGYRTIPCILFTPPSTNVWGVYNGRERVWRPANGVFQFRERERVGRGEKKSRGNCTPDQMIFCCRQLPGCSCVTHFLCVWCCSCVCVCVLGECLFFQVLERIRRCTSSKYPETAREVKLTVINQFCSCCRIIVTWRFVCKTNTIERPIRCNYFSNSATCLYD